eukprot:765927-Hanusia_phi.AAC.5
MNTVQESSEVCSGLRADTDRISLSFARVRGDKSLVQLPGRQVCEEDSSRSAMCGLMDVSQVEE